MTLSIPEECRLLFQLWFVSWFWCFLIFDFYNRLMYIFFFDFGCCSHSICVFLTSFYWFSSLSSCTKSNINSFSSFLYYFLCHSFLFHFLFDIFRTVDIIFAGKWFLLVRLKTVKYFLIFIFYTFADSRIVVFKWLYFFQRTIIFVFCIKFIRYSILIKCNYPIFL